MTTDITISSFQEDYGHFSPVKYKYLAHGGYLGALGAALKSFKM